MATVTAPTRRATADEAATASTTARASRLASMSLTKLRSIFSWAAGSVRR